MSPCKTLRSDKIEIEYNINVNKFRAKFKPITESVTLLIKAAAVIQNVTIACYYHIACILILRV